MIDKMGACNLFCYINQLLALPAGLLQEYIHQIRMKLQLTHWFLTLDNKEVLKRSLRKILAQ